MEKELRKLTEDFGIKANVIFNQYHRYQRGSSAIDFLGCLHSMRG